VTNQDDDRVPLEAPQDPGELYEYLGAPVPLSRPLSQGDILQGVTLAGGTELDLVMIMSHPCSMRRGSQLQPELVIAEIRNFQPLAQRKWPDGYYDHLPLPGLHPLVRSTSGAASFRHLHTIDSKELALDKRVAVLSDYGQIVLLQRWIHQLSRVTVHKQELTEQLRPVQTEISLQERWCAAAVRFRAAGQTSTDQVTTADTEQELGDADAKQFQQFLGLASDPQSLRRRLAASETNHVQARHEIVTEIRTRFPR